MGRTVFVPSDTIDRLRREGVDPSEWARQTFKLGLLANRNLVFQKAGEEYLQLRVEHMRQTLTSRNLMGASVVVEDEVVKEVERTTKFSLDEWWRRAMILRERAENLRLHSRSGENDEMVEISFDRSPEAKE